MLFARLQPSDVNNKPSITDLGFGSRNSLRYKNFDTGDSDDRSIYVLNWLQKRVQSWWFPFNFVLSSFGNFTLTSGFTSFLSSSMVFLFRSALIFTLDSSIFSSSWILFRSLTSSSSVSSVIDLFSSAILSFSVVASSFSLPWMNSSSLSFSSRPYLLISLTSFSSPNMASWTWSWICASLFSMKVAIFVTSFN